MVNFLLLIERIIDFSKTDIDKGNTPPEIYKICSSIRTAFCLSYDIRKNNNLFLYFQHNKILIEFEGNKLRYLGPDERSQALLLKKALDKFHQNEIRANEEWIESTPGIKIVIFKNQQSFMLWVKSLKFKYIVCMSESTLPPEFQFLTLSTDYLKIEPLNKFANVRDLLFVISLNSQNYALLIAFITNLSHLFPALLDYTILTPLDNIKTPEDKILYINFEIDQQQGK